MGISTPRKADLPSVDHGVESGSFELLIDAQDDMGANRRGRCGAMVQQRGDVGCQSAPQKFVHLVGCRDSNVCLDKEDHLNSSKR